MAVTANIYEGVEGLLIDCLLYDKTMTPVASDGILNCHLIVLRPGSVEEEVWTAVAVAPNIIRHVVPEGANILAGKHKIQPYIEATDGFKGRWGTVEMLVSKKMR